MYSLSALLKQRIKLLQYETLLTVHHVQITFAPTAPHTWTSVVTLRLARCAPSRSQSITAHSKIICTCFIYFFKRQKSESASSRRVDLQRSSSVLVVEKFHFISCKQVKTNKKNVLNTTILVQFCIFLFCPGSFQTWNKIMLCSIKSLDVLRPAFSRSLTQ